MDLNENQNVHAGHRDRAREEFMAHPTPTKLPDHKLLEMLLFYGIPRRDTNGIAHELINRFGSFHGVLEADVTDLCTVKGMTKNAACLIKLILPLSKTYINSKYADNTILKTHAQIGSFVLKKYFGTSVEICSLLCLSHAGKILSYEVLTEGDIDSVGISVRSVVERAVIHKANSVVLVHNHPGGVPLPSVADVAVTASISRALKTISVKFTDHIIIADNDYVSMAQSKEYEGLFD